MKRIALALLRKIALIRLEAKECQLGSSVVLNGIPYIRRKGSGQIILGARVNINASPMKN